MGFMRANKDPCRPCLYYPICMERRGRCTEYKDLEGVKREIEMLNKEAGTSATAEGDNEAGPR